MIKFFGLSKLGGVLIKGSANLFSERASLPRWQKQNQMPGGVLMKMGMVEIAACGKNRNCD